MKKTKYFNIKIKKYFQLDDGCCSTCSLSFKRNCKCLKFSLWGLLYTINIGIAMIGTLIVFGMLMIAKMRKKDRRTGWKTVVLKEKERKTLRAKVLAIFIMKILFAFLGIFFLVTYIRETDFLCLMIYLLAFACVMHFHQEIKTRKIIKILKGQMGSFRQ